jgi:hypothetical protein
MPDAERRFHMWKIATTDLLTESSTHPGEEPIEETTIQYSHQLTKRILGLFDGLMRNTNEEIMLLEELIQYSIRLDLKICQQAACVDWDFASCISSTSLDPQPTAELADDTKPRLDQDVRLVVAPAVWKLGRCTVQDYETRIQVVEMIVIDVPFSGCTAFKGCQGPDSEYD